MSNTPTVFVTNKSTVHDYTSAMQYGALRFVTTGNYPIFKTMRLQESIIDVLVHSNKDDYLLFSGSSVVAALCMLIWVKMHGYANILLWDRTQDKYVTRVIEGGKLEINIEQARDLAGRMVRGSPA